MTTRPTRAHHRLTIRPLTAQGGGIYNKNAEATLNFSSVTGNTASGSTAGPPSSDGGGIFNNGGTLMLNFSLVSGNKPNNCSPSIGFCT